MNKKSQKSITLVKEILLRTFEEGKTIYEIFSNPYMYEKYDFGDSDKRKMVLTSTINRLRNEGFLEKIEKRGVKRYRATLKGKAKILSYIKKDKRWDGKWRIVVFDIPEKERKMRDFFRLKLNELGFRKLQESVFICPFNISNLVEELIELCEARNYIHYLLVEELDNRDVLMRLFKLSEKKKK